MNMRERNERQLRAIAWNIIGAVVATVAILWIIL